MFRTVRLAAYHACPYYASGLFSLVPVAAPGYGTWAVDKCGGSTLILPCWWAADAWSIQDASGVLLHELGHLLRVHTDRAFLPQPHNHSLWRLSLGAEIGDDLLDAGVPLPKGWVTRRRWDACPTCCGGNYYAHLAATAPPQPESAQPGGRLGGWAAQHQPGRFDPAAGRQSGRRRSGRGESRR